MKQTVLVRLERLLSHPKMPLFTVLIAAVLVSPVLATGFQTDDFHDYSRALNDPLSLLERPVMTPERVARAKETGRLPWWSSPNVRPPGQLRPLGATSLWLDLRFWPGQPLPAHAHSALMYLLLVMAAGVLFRQLFGPGWVANAATLMYAVDDAHGFTVGYIHGRSRLISLIFVCLAAAAFVRQRKEGWRPGLLLGPLALVLGLLTYEAGVLTLAIVLPYALLLDRASLRARALSVLPYLTVTALWMWVYSSGQSASHGSGMYADPIGEPLRFAHNVGAQLPLYLASTLGFLPTDPFLLFTPAQYRVGWAVAALMLAALLAGLAGVLRADREARFFLLVVLLGCLPACAAFPNDRLLMVAHIGAFGLAARVLAILAAAERPPTALRALGGAFIFCHLVLASALLPVRVVAMDQTIGRAQRAAFTTLGQMDISPEQTLVVLNAPDVLMAMVPGLAVARRTIPRVDNMVFGISRDPLRVERVDARTITLQPDAGYLHETTSTFLRGEEERFEVGDEVAVLGHVVRVDSVTSDGRPARVRLTAAGPSLESLRLLVWSDAGVRTYTPPPVGEHEVLPAIDYAELYLRPHR
jgi:hypothetical protein